MERRPGHILERHDLAENSARQADVDIGKSKGMHISQAYSNWDILNRIWATLSSHNACLDCINEPRNTELIVFSYGDFVKTVTSQMRDIKLPILADTLMDTQ